MIHGNEGPQIPIAFLCRVHVSITICNAEVSSVRNNAEVGTCVVKHQQKLNLEMGSHVESVLVTKWRVRPCTLSYKQLFPTILLACTWVTKSFSSNETLAFARTAHAVITKTFLHISSTALKHPQKQGL